MAAKLSALGLYRWNPHLFDDMVLPEGLEKNEVIHAILEETAELEILFSDPDYLQESIGHWSAARLQSWEKMQAAITAEYNPIWNKDGTIIDQMIYGEDKVTGVTGARDQTNTHSVSGFNVTTFQNADQDHATSVQATDTNTRQTHTDTRTITEQGNIGVTKSQEMVNDEMMLRIRWNMISVIVSDFKNKYCLMVY